MTTHKNWKVLKLRIYKIGRVIEKNSWYKRVYKVIDIVVKKMEYTLNKGSNLIIC